MSVTPVTSPDPPPADGARRRGGERPVPAARRAGAGPGPAGPRPADDGGARWRALLRIAVVCLAAVVTVLAAAPPLPQAGAATSASVAGPPGDGPPTAPPPDAGSPVPVPVRPPGAGRRAPGADHAWPLVPVPAVVTPFRQPTFRFGRGHRGADLAGAPGQAVLATREGLVAFAGRVAGRPVVSVDHPDGLRTTYEPVFATVRAGDRVGVGDPLGVLAAGHAGCPSTCLHWGVRRGKVDYLDPLVLVRPPGVRLLPVGAEGTPGRAPG